MKKLRVSADETVFVGDTLDADIEGAKGVGMRSVYIKRRTEKAIASAEPDKIINSLSELPSTLKEFLTNNKFNLRNAFA